ncbi:MAG: ABC transporter substrate-binding protein, partial [Anaerolineae bacterium]
MYKLRRVILPVLILGLILSGCGIGSPLAGAEPVVLRYAYEGATPEIEALLSEFQDTHPNITVELLGPGTEESVLMQGVLNGDIDLVRGGAEALGLAQQRLLLPLDEVNLDAWADIRDDYFGGLWESLSVSGEQYGIPSGLDTVVTF